MPDGVVLAWVTEMMSFRVWRTRSLRCAESLSSAEGRSGQSIQFRTGPVELDFEVAVTRSGGGGGGDTAVGADTGRQAGAGACDHAEDQGDVAAGGLRWNQ